MTDGGRQLQAAAAAIRDRDVDALEDAFERLRDDPPAGPRLRTIDRAARELRRAAFLVRSMDLDTCDKRASRLADVFSERFVLVTANES